MYMAMKDSLSRILTTVNTYIKPSNSFIKF